MEELQEYIDQYVTILFSKGLTQAGKALCLATEYNDISMRVILSFVWISRK